MGCHAGLAVSDQQTGVPTTTWAKTFADQGALWVANSGFGYGDTSTIALSARLMSDFAARLDGSSTIGAALAFAKQRYAADTPTVSAYDMKALMEATFYGLPMYRLKAPSSTPAPYTAPAVHVDPSTGLSVAPVTTAPGFQLAPGGGYYSVNGQTAVTEWRPIEPLSTVEITQPAAGGGALGLVAHGALVTSLTSVDHTGFTPAYARPVVDSSAHEPALGAGDAVYPGALSRVSTYLGPDGRHQQLDLVTGEFLSGSPGVDGTAAAGTQRLFTGVGALVYYDQPGTAAAADYTPPSISASTAVAIGSSVSFRVAASDPASTVKRVLVLYTDAVTPGSWTPVDLVQGPGGAWTGGGAAPPSGKIAYLVQAVDASGNVATSSNKGVYFPAVVSPASPNLQVSLTSVGAPSGSFYTGPVTVALAGGPQITYSLDGSALQPYTSPVVVAGDGPHDLRAADALGDSAEQVFAIDGTGPATVATVAPGTSATGWSTVGATVLITAFDAGGSGVRSLTWSATGAQAHAAATVGGAVVSVPITTDGQTTFSFSAVDNAGNNGPVGTFTIKFDGEAPTVSCGTAPTAWSATDVSIACHASDAVSGFANPAQASFTLSTAVAAGAETAAAATGGASVCDVAGLCTTIAPFSGLKVDKKAPAATITTSPTGTTFATGQSVKVTYVCTDGGSGVASCAGKLVGANGVLTPVASGGALDTSMPGTHTFEVVATDNVGNTSATTLTYAVSAGICTPVPPGGAAHGIAVFDLELCGPNGQNLTVAGIVITATAVDGTTAPVAALPAVNPGNRFVFVPLIKVYLYTLNTSKLAAGTHTLSFTVAGDPTVHTVTFKLV